MLRVTDCTKGKAVCRRGIRWSKCTAVFTGIYLIILIMCMMSESIIQTCKYMYQLVLSVYTDILKTVFGQKDKTSKTLSLFLAVL